MAEAKRKSPTVEETKGGPETEKAKSTPPSEKSESTLTTESAASTPVNPPVPPKPQAAPSLDALMARLEQLESNQAKLVKSQSDDDDILSPTAYPITESQEVSQLPVLFTEKDELEALIPKSEVASRFGLNSEDVSGYTVRGYDPDDAYLVVVLHETGEKKVQRWHG